MKRCGCVVLCIRVLLRAFLVFFVSVVSTVAVAEVFYSPYAQNAWDYPDTACVLLQRINLNRYRNFVNWGDVERTDIPKNAPVTSGYDWWHVRQAATAGKNFGAKVMYGLWGSPDWSRTNVNQRLSARPTSYADYITALLTYSATIDPNVCHAVDLGNEDPVWESNQEQDPSWYYQHLLRAGYEAVKAFNSSITVLPACVWQDAAHFYDEMYQLGLHPYIEALNIHPYNNTPTDILENNGIVSHYATCIRYLKYIAEQNGDHRSLVWNTEYAYKNTTEANKTVYLQQVLDISRKCGFVPYVAMYPGIAGGYPDDYDHGGLVYCYGAPWISTVAVTTAPAYNMYRDYIQQYPYWDSTQTEDYGVLPPAGADAVVPNPGFENGAAGWTGGTIDTTEKHSGTASIRQTNTGSIESTNFITVEKGRLYEVMFWIKITGSHFNNYQVEIPILQEGAAGWYWPNRFNGMVDTRNYPGGWKRVRYMYYPQTTSGFTGRIKLRFAGRSTSGATGTFWIDDISIKALNLRSLGVQLTEPANGATYTAPATIPCTATVTNSTTVSRVEFYAGTLKFGEDTSSPYAFTWAGVAAGTYTITARAVDAQGAAFSNAVVVYVNAPPVAPPPALAAGEVRFIGGTDGVFNAAGGAPMTIRFHATRPGTLTFSFYTVTGSLARILKVTVPDSGEYETFWDARSDAGKDLPAGVYLVRISGAGFNTTRKIAIVR